MASTYTYSGIELIATGEQANTWGITTNTNWEIIEEGVSGVVSVALTSTSYTLTTSDGALSEGRHAVIIFTGTPGGTCTVTISPNDLQKTYFIDNQTNQTVTLTQGSGGNVSFTAGAKGIVFCNGAGAGAKVTEVLGANLSDLANITPSEGTLIVGDGSTWVDAGLSPDNGAVIIGNGTTWETTTGLADFEGLTPTNDHWIYADGTNWTTTTGAGKLQTWTGKITADGYIDDATFVGSVKEETYDLTGSASINPANGTIQYLTLSSDTTFSVTLTEGQYVVLMVMATNGGTTYEAFWSDTIDWKTEGGNKPTMNIGTYATILLWKANDTLFGARVGDS